MTCVTLTSWPSSNVDTPTLVKTGGTDSEVWLLASVTVTNTGEDSVVSGLSVIVLVAVGDGVFALACTTLGAPSESSSCAFETGESEGTDGCGVTSECGAGVGGGAAETCGVWASGVVRS